MAYLIYTTDKPGREAVRAEHRAAHYAFLEAHSHLLIASGGLQDDAGSAFVGAAILIACDTRDEAEAFLAADPFSSVDLFEEVRITRWKPAFLAGERVNS